MDARILAAATTLFLEQGVAATSCDAVAARARVGKASLYARYSGKDALFEAVVKQAVESTAHQSPVLAPPVGDMKSNLAAAGRAVLSYALSPVPLELMRLLLTEARRNPDLIAQVDEMARAKVVDMIVGSILNDNGSEDRKCKARELAERFIDLTFSPLILAALSGRRALTSPEAIKAQIDVALALLEGAEMLHESESGSP